MGKWVSFFSILLCFSANAAKKEVQYLIQFTDPSLESQPALQDYKSKSLKIEKVTKDWSLITAPKGLIDEKSLMKDSSVAWIQPNYPLEIFEDYQLQDHLRRQVLERYLAKNPQLKMVWGNPKDNPDFALPEVTKKGVDPLLKNQWGMTDVGLSEAWSTTQGSEKMIVAVIDTGIDYNHPDLIQSLWKNPGEIGKDEQGRDQANNGVDDDQNGFVDDVIGWDFVSNDNKPYDLSKASWSILLSGGNPGHGTHCAGSIAAQADNSIGIAGVAPKVKLMALRFLTEKGQGTTADAIRAIKYAVDNGAKILSNSWGSMGENETDNKALQDIVKYAEDHGVLFIAAAGNGRGGRGYDNDESRFAAIPASYDFENIISVAALDSKNELGVFSNWGFKSVDIGAPGVRVLSTVVGNRYSDTVVNVLGLKISWDGTSMATPFVSGAAALYWSAHPEKTWQEVKSALLLNVEAIPSLHGKVSSEGKLNLKKLMGY